MAISFSNVFNPLDGLEKLKIETFDNDQYSGAQKTYLVMYNPTTFSQDYKNVYETVEVDGTQNNYKFKRTEAPSLTLELLFDATGASITQPTKAPSAGGGTLVDLAEEVRGKDTFNAINTFIDDLTSIKGEEHKTSYLSVSWGNFIFNGILDNAKVTHLLFKANGLPIRSKVNCTFKSHISFEQQAAEAKKTSPDLTKFHMVKGEDTLPLIAFDKYRDPVYYMELARVNKLNNFRSLSNGYRLRLPPVEK